MRCFARETPMKKCYSLKIVQMVPIRAKRHFYLKIIYLVIDDFCILVINNNDFKVTSLERFLVNRDHPPLNKDRCLLTLVIKEHNFVI